MLAQPDLMASNSITWCARFVRLFFETFYGVNVTNGCDAKDLLKVYSSKFQKIPFKDMDLTPSYKILLSSHKTKNKEFWHTSIYFGSFQKDLLSETFFSFMEANIHNGIKQFRYESNTFTTSHSYYFFDTSIIPTIKDEASYLDSSSFKADSFFLTILLTLSVIGLFRFLKS